MKRMAVALFITFSALLFATPSWAITTFGANPNDPMYAAGAGTLFDGVASLALTFGSSTSLCSGSLLATGLHVLTAGHCVTDFFGAALPTTSSATFITESGATTIAGAAYTVYPLWDGNVMSGTDLAILTLVAMAPADAQRYEIYRDPDEVNQIGSLTGFGIAGSGATGATLDFGTRRKGSNKIDALGSFIGWSPNILMGDFDNGLAVNDAFAVLMLPPNLGLGDPEVSTAPGDSGGPMFLAGKIAGVHSLGATIGCPPDLVTPANLMGPEGCKLDASFGEFFGDTRVSSFESFIDATITPIPEPASILLLSSGLAGLAGYLARRRKRDGAGGGAVRGVPGPTSGRRHLGRPGRNAFHPHLHTLVRDGVFGPSGWFYAFPWIDHRVLEELFRHRVLQMLLRDQRIDEALVRTDGNITCAAKELGVSRPTFHDLLARHDLDHSQFRG